MSAHGCLRMLVTARVTLLVLPALYRLLHRDAQSREPLLQE